LGFNDLSQIFIKKSRRPVFVIPAKAGIQVCSALAEGKKDWIPAVEEWPIFHGAGMTTESLPIS